MRKIFNKILIACICLLPLSFLMSKAMAKDFEDVRPLADSQSVDGEIIVNNYDGESNSFLSFVEASKTDTFAGKTVSINMEQKMTLDESFTGIGGPNTAFEGTLKIIKAKIDNGTSSSYFFNNLSSSATFTGNTLEMFVNYGKPLTNKLTVVSGSTLDLSHFSYINGSSMSVNGSGIVANTLDGSGALTVSFGNMLSNVSSATFSSTTDAGLITGVLPNNIELSMSGITTPTLTGSSSMNIGGIVGTCNGTIHVTGENTFKTSSGNCAGGICGVLNGTITITGTTTVTGSNALYGGGIVAKTVSESSITATSLTLNSTIIGNNNNGSVGGIVGENDTTITMNGLTLVSTVSGAKNTGGFIGASLANSYMKGDGIATANLNVIGGWSGYAGGIIADATKGTNELSVSFSSGSKVTGQGLTGGIYGIYSDANSADMLTPTFEGSLILRGDSTIGGYIGKAVITKNIVLSNDKFNVSVNKGDWFGGTIVGLFIGELEVSSNFTFNITKTITTEGFGLFGTISSNNKANDIVINGNDKTFTTSNLSSSQGVVVSKITSNTYVKIDGIVATANVSNVALVNTVESNAVVEIGKASYNNSTGAIFVAEAKEGAVVYLNGAITSPVTKHIVKKINQSLVYANTSTFTWTTNSKSGWEVGSYGGIIKDRVGTGTPFITFNDSNNSVSLDELTVNNKTIIINSVKDAVLYAISFQTAGAISAITNVDYSKFKAYDIDLQAAVDLTNTGIESFSISTTENGSYAFKGTFKGNGKTITLFIGKDYTGELRKREYISQVFIGLFARTQDANFEDLTILGSMNLGFNSSVNNVGVFSAVMSDTTVIKNCQLGSASNRYTVTSTGIALGGGIAAKCTNSTLTLTKTGDSGNKFYSSIQVNGTAGGLIAQFKVAKSILIEEATIDTIVEAKWNCGAIIGAIEESSGTKTTIKNNIIKTNVTSVEAGEANGIGLIGAIWENTVVDSILIDNNTIDSTITSTQSKSEAQVGTIIGCFNEPEGAQVSTLKISNNIIKSIISCKKRAAFIIGSYENSTSTEFDLSNNTIQEGSTINSTNTTGIVGGLVSVLSFVSLTDVNVSGTIVNGTLTTNSCSTANYAGGLLGYEWKNTIVRLTGAHNLSNTSKGMNAGICSIFEGILVVESSFKNAGTLTTTSGKYCGVITIDQTKAMVFVHTSYSNLMKTISGKTELSVYTEESDGLATQGGLLSIELNGSLGSMKNNSNIFVTSDTNWGSYFTNILSQNNSKVRYYFNTYNYFYNGNTPQKKDSSIITSSSDLVYWHLRDYLFDNDLFSDEIKNLFYSGNVNNVTTSGALTLNMTDYCFYPTNKQSSTMDFKNSTVTFGLTNSNMKTASMTSNSQFYGLQYGFLMGTMATSSNESIVTIKNLTLAGEFGSDSNYSGVLIIDEFNGYHGSNTNVKGTLTINNLTLAGIKNNKTTNPLLIRTIGQELDMTVEGIYAYSNSTTENYAGTCYYTSVAASALFGVTGDTEAVDLKITLKKIAVDNCMFSTALFFTSMLYGAGSKATYEFSQSEDFLNGIHIKKVTYGGEITFEDQECYLNSEVYVHPNNADEAYNFVNEHYLYYCGTSANNDYKFLFYVNRKKSNLDIEDGFGTYEHPYIINNGGQLIVLADIISSGTIPEGFVINFPSNVSSPTAYGKYTYENAAFTLNSGTANSSISIDLIRTWLQGAYFSIEPLSETNILDLSSKKFENFIGVGNIFYPFHGVFVGKNKGTTIATIKMPLNMSVDNTGYNTGVNGIGFINVSNGCAVYNIKIQYTNIVYKDSATAYPAKATNVISPSPTSTTIGTNYFYFGGVIGMHIGGDASVASTIVDYLGTTLTSNNATSIFGGLVGYVVYGGVIFDNGNDVNISYDVSNTHLYFNKYVGKVLSGFSVELNSTSSYNNLNLKDTNYVGYKIAALANPNGQINVVSAGYSKVTVDNAEELFIFALMTNCGYRRTNEIYVANAVRSRYYAYSGVGTNANVTNGLYSQDTFTESTIPFICKYMDITMTPTLKFELVFVNTTYDLSVYGNSYRGIGVLFDRYSEVNKGNVLINNFKGNSAKIKLDTEIRQVIGSAVEVDLLTYLGFISYADHSPNITNLTVFGNYVVRFIGTTGSVSRTRSGVIYLGGIIGMSKYAYFENVHVGTATNSMYLEGPALTGGFVGEYNCAGYDRYVKNSSVENTIIVSNTFCGGMFGRLKTNTVFPVSNSEIKNVKLILAPNQCSDIFMAGIVAKLERDNNNNGHLSMTKTNINNCDFIIHFNSSPNVSGSTSESHIGGYVGYSDKPKVTLTYSTLDSTNIIGLGKRISEIGDLLGTQPTNFSETSKLSTIVSKAKITLLSNMSTGDYLKVTAAGVVAKCTNTVVIDNFKITSDTRETCILGYNNASGFVGELTQNDTSITITNSNILATSNHIYIMGISRATGVVSYRDNSRGTITLTNVHINGNQSINSIETHKSIFIISVYNNDNHGSANGFVGGSKNSKIVMNNCSLRECIMLGRNVSGVVNYQQDGQGVEADKLLIEDCYFYGVLSSAAISSRKSSDINLKNIIIRNSTFAGVNNTTAGSVFTGIDQAANITAYDMMLYNIGLGVATIDFTGITAEYNNVYSKIYNLALTGVKSSDSSSIDTFGVKAIQTRTTLSTGNFGYLVYSGTGCIRIYNVVRSEESSIPLTPITIPKFGTGVTNGVGVIVDYGIYDADNLNTSFGAYKTFMGSTYNGDITKIEEVIENYGYIAEPETGYKVNGEQNALTGNDTYPLIGEYLQASDVSNYHMSTTKIEQSQFVDIFSDSETTTYNLAGIIGVQSSFSELSENIISYLDLITFGGFSEQMVKQSSGLAIESYRYSYWNGVVTKKAGMTGSIIYSNGAFSFNDGVNGGYDLLSGGDDLSFTILYITFSYGDYSYTFSLALYYEQILEMDSHVVPMVGENYLISSYTSGNHVQLDPTEYLSLYIEYAYSDVAERIPFNFDKKIVSVTNEGSTSGSSLIPAGTKFKLVDISSASTAGYKMYYYQLEAASREINLSLFSNTSDISYIPLNTLSELTKITTNENYTYIERYILVVEFPSENIDSDLTFFFVADETSKNNVRIQHDKGTNFADFTHYAKVLPSPSADLATSYVSNSELSGTFSNFSEDPIDEIISGEITVPYNYYTLAVGNKYLYGVYKFVLTDADHNVVALPNNTEFVVAVGGTQYTRDVSNLSTITYSLGDILTQVRKKSNSDDYELAQNMTVKLDFGKCSSIDFNSTFTQGALYTLTSEFYLSVDESQYNTGSRYTLAGKTYTANLVVDVKVNMVAEDSRHLGINISPVEMDDATNNGEIDFNLVVDFSALDDQSIPEEATVTFSLYRKTLVNGEYKYVEYSTSLPEGIVGSLGDVYYNNAIITDNQQTLSVSSKKAEGKFTYKVDFPMNGTDIDSSKILLTSYRLAVKVSYNGQSASVNDYDTFLVFLIVEINTN